MKLNLFFWIYLILCIACKISVVKKQEFLKSGMILKNENSFENSSRFIVSKENKYSSKKSFSNDLNDRQMEKTIPDKKDNNKTSSNFIFQRKKMFETKFNQNQNTQIYPKTINEQNNDQINIKQNLNKESIKNNGKKENRIGNIFSELNYKMKNENKNKITKNTQGTYENVKKIEKHPFNLNKNVPEQNTNDVGKSELAEMFKKVANDKNKLFETGINTRIHENKEEKKNELSVNNEQNYFNDSELKKKLANPFLENDLNNLKNKLNREKEQLVLKNSNSFLSKKSPSFKEKKPLKNIPIGLSKTLISFYREFPLNSSLSSSKSHQTKQSSVQSSLRSSDRLEERESFINVRNKFEKQKQISSDVSMTHLNKGYVSPNELQREKQISYQKWVTFERYVSKVAADVRKMIKAIDQEVNKVLHDKEHEEDFENEESALSYYSYATELQMNFNRQKSRTFKNLSSQYLMKAGTLYEYLNKKIIILRDKAFMLKEVSNVILSIKEVVADSNEQPDDVFYSEQDELDLENKIKSRKRLLALTEEINKRMQTYSELLHADTEVGFKIITIDFSFVQSELQLLENDRYAISKQMEESNEFKVSLFREFNVRAVILLDWFDHLLKEIQSAANEKQFEVKKPEIENHCRYLYAEKERIESKLLTMREKIIFQIHQKNRLSQLKNPPFPPKEFQSKLLENQ